MDVSVYETALALESGRGPAEERRAAFAEQFALAVDVDAKRSLVSSLLEPKSVDELYFSSLCTLIQLQSLLDEKRPQSDEQAWVLLTSQIPHLQSAVSALRTTHSAEKQAARLRRRWMLLELEVSRRVDRTQAELKVHGKVYILDLDMRCTDGQNSPID